MKTIILGILMLTCIVLAYFLKKDYYRKSQKAIETQTFSYGLLYYFKPVSGDKAIRLARSYAIIGQVLSYFFCFFSIIAFILLL